jgi:poly-gamma-glutamate synthesis protein (capsule biosynthesis protein)
LSGAVAQQAPAVPRERTLLFVGDVMLSRGVGAKMKAEGDWTYPFQKIAATLAAADLTFGNLECPVSDVGRDRYHLYSFRADPGAIEGLKHAGFDVMSVANNHIYDWGAPALLDTLRRLREAGIMPVGAGANDLEAHYPQLLNCTGLKLAFLAYVNIAPETAIAAPDRPGVAWLEPDRVLADIRFARPLADLVVVALHWGNEYVTRPQPNQVELAHQMIDAGADLVVGSHAHVVQPVEEYRGRWIAYSLGNFVFDQKGPGTRRGAMLKVKLVDKQITEVTSVPITIDGAFQAIITPPEELAREALRASQRSKARATRAQ